MLLNCGVWEDCRPLGCKDIKSVHSKGNQPWTFIGRTDVEAETPIIWPSDAKSWLTGKDPGVGKIEGRGEGDNRGWYGWMASLTRWTGVSASSGSWWRTGKPGMLQSMGSQRVWHDWATELNWMSNAVLGCNLKNDRMISVHFQGKPFNITVFQSMPQSVMLKKLQLNSSMKTDKTF